MLAFLTLVGDVCKYYFERPCLHIENKYITSPMDADGENPPPVMGAPRHKADKWNK